MDLFQHRYYRLNKFLLKIVGVWPYQSFRVRVISVVLISLVSAISIPQIIAIAKHRDDRDFLVQSALPLFYNYLCMSKYYTCIFNSSEMLKLLNHMRSNWKIWGQDCDVDILHKYAEKGRTMTIYYTGYQPVIPKIIDFLLKNGTKPGQFPIPVDFIYIDMQKHYFYIIVYSAVCALIGSLVAAAADVMFMVYVQHGCGLFAILRHKLERLGNNQISADLKSILYKSDKPLITLEYLGWCIDKHNNAIKFAELIDETYTLYSFFFAVFNTILISVEGVQIIERRNELDLTLKFICSIAVTTLHLYVECYMGQILIDHSISIRDYIITGKWYVLPLKAQKLLPLMIMRCNIPCKITAARLRVMSVETFSMILKTSLSYFTLLRSV